MSYGNLFHSLLTQLFNHANIFSKQQTVGKMSDYELLLPNNFGSGWDKVHLAQKGNNRGRGVAIRMPWYVVFEKINSRGGHLFQTGDYMSMKVMIFIEDFTQIVNFVLRIPKYKFYSTIIRHVNTGGYGGATPPNH